MHARVVIIRIIHLVNLELVQIKGKFENTVIGTIINEYACIVFKCANINWRTVGAEVGSTGGPTDIVIRSEKIFRN